MKCKLCGFEMLDDEIKVADGDDILHDGCFWKNQLNTVEENFLNLMDAVEHYLNDKYTLEQLGNVFRKLKNE